MTQPNEPGATIDPGATPEGAAAGGDSGDNGDLAPPAANNWWQFSDKEAAEAWANNLVTKRLQRERKTNFEPLQQSHATLEAELARLKPLAEKAMTAEEKRDAEFAQAQQEIEDLRSFKAQVERSNLVNGIAIEVGLPDHLTSFLNADADEASIREQAKNLLNALSEGGSNTGKRKPPAKSPAPKDQGDSGNGDSASGGGGGNGEPSDDALIAHILEETAKIRANGGITFR